MAGVDPNLRNKSKYNPVKGFSEARKKRAEEEEAERSYAEELRQKAKKTKDQSKKQSGKSPLDTVNDAIKGVAGFLFSGTEKVADSIGGLTGAVERKNNTIDKDLREGRIDSAEAMKRRQALIDDIKWAGDGKRKNGSKETTSDRLKKAAGVTLEAGSELIPIPIGKAVKGASLGVKVAKGAAAGAIGAGVGSAGAQLVQDGKIDALTTAKSVGLGAAMGGAMPVIGKALKGTDKAAGKAIDKATGKGKTIKSDLLTSYEGAPDRAQVELYKQKIANGEELAPLKVLKDSKGNLGIEDGKHRFQAYQEMGVKDIPVEGATTNGFQNLGEKGVVGTLNNMLSRTARKATYAASDAIDSTKIGHKVIDMKDKFMTAWVAENHQLYKALKRSDFEGRTDGAYLAAREAIGGSNRALSFAQDFMENNQNLKKMTQGIEGKNANGAGVADMVKARKDFDEFAKVRSELDLAAAGKKDFSPAKLDELKAREASLKTDYNDEYQALVGYYKDLNDFRLKEGLISKEDYDRFMDEGFDYVRQQRELPDWMLDKPAQQGKGAAASITKSSAIQKRNKYADAELMSPTETLIKTTQLAHVEAMRNKAAKTVSSLLEEAGEAKLRRSTDIVREKQALLRELKESKPVAERMYKALRSQKKAVANLQKEINALRKEGRIELKREMKKKGQEIEGRIIDPATPLNPKQVMEELVSLDSKELRKIRAMIERRNAKMAPLLDTVEIMNRDLADIYAKRKGLWTTAQGMKSSFDKKNKTTMSFLDDGVENIVEVSPEVASAIHTWDKQYQNILMDVMRFSNNVFKYGTTGANAGFALPNFVADQVGSAVNSRNVMATHNPVNFTRSLFMALGKPLNAEDAKILQSYTKANKGQLSINQYTKKATSDKVASKLFGKDANWGSKTYTTLTHPKQAMRALFDATEGAVGATESITRVQNYRGAYKQAAKEGLEVEKVANQQARENSVDFLEMGAYGRVVNSFIPYFNAAVQGNRVMLRNAAERPASFAAKATVLVGVPTVATTAWNTMDSDRKAIYDTIPEYIKESNFVVIGPGAHWNEATRKWDGVYMMKKPPGFKEFAEPVRKYLEHVADNDPNKASGLWGFIGEEGGGVAADFAGTFSPIDFTDQNKFLSSVTPQILKPTAEAILNKNFFQGEDIVPQYMGDRAPEDQKYENYSQLTSHIAGMFNTSPLKVDHWIRQTFGEVGTNAQHYIDRYSGASEEATGGRSLPESVTRRFGSPSGGADTDAFYETYNPALSARKRASAEVTDLVKQGKLHEAKRKAEEYNTTIDGRFEKFMLRYADSPTYDEKWNERIDELRIPVTDRAFKARKRQE